MAPPPAVQSPDIARVTLHRRIPTIWHLYALPFICLYPVLGWAYLLRYDDLIRSEEWTFVYTVGLLTAHALSFLVTRWSVAARALITCRSARSVDDAEVVRVFPHPHKGEGELVPLVAIEHEAIGKGRQPLIEISFTYQADKYILTLPDPKAPVSSVLVSPLVEAPTFRRLPYPADSAPPLSEFQASRGLTPDADVEEKRRTFGENVFDIPRPTFLDLFAEHAVAPFFVFQIFCVGLWMLDEYWYYSLFTLFMLVVFECTVVFQRVRTLNEFRTMSIQPYQIQVYRSGKWSEVSTTALLPGDIVSVTRSKEDSGTPCDLLLLSGSVIVNEAMLSGESTPLLKESIELRDGSDRLDVNGADRNSVVFGGTKVLQTTASDGDLKTPDGGAPAVVLRTGFGTTQGALIRLMVFTNEGRVTAGNIESFVFIGFLLVFAIAASWYVWTRGLEMGRPKGKLLLDCVLIITSVVPPELPMELSMAVNASLMALSKHAIFCTEPFRIPYAGRVDVCCFDKTGTITGEDLVVQGVAPVGARTPKDLVPIVGTGRETTLTLAAAHALVLLEDGLVGDPMEKTTLEALGWTLGKGDVLQPAPPVKDENGVAPAPRLRAQVQIRRRFQFSSSLKRMSTLSFVQEGGKRQLLAAVKGAPETLRGMYRSLPADYDETFKTFTRRGSRVLALGYRYLDGGADTINAVTRDQVESGLEFAGFLVFHCPLKPDAVTSLKQLHDSSHRCIMITGDNPLTAVHVAGEVEIVDRETLILDVENDGDDSDRLVWRTVDDAKIIPQNAADDIDASLFDEYDVCLTGPAMRRFEQQPAKWDLLVQNTWVYARVSPAQKELILNTLKRLGYVTLMAGDGTNDVGALKAANIGVALLDGTLEDMEKIAKHARNERMKKVYESQLKLTARFGQPPPPVPPALKEVYPDLEKAREEALKQLQASKLTNPSQRPTFDLSGLTASMADLDTEDGPPQIRLGDASVAAPFTSKLANVAAILHIIRQGRASLVATVQMYKILGLNCLIQAYSLSVLYLDGIKFGDYQVTISGMLMSVCFLMISRAQTKDRLSKERPITNILNWYSLLSILFQFALHIASTMYITRLVPQYEKIDDVVDLEAKFSPSLLNTVIFLIGLSQSVSTFTVNFIGEPWRESMRSNSALYYPLLACFGVAFAGCVELVPELNSWLQLVPIPGAFQVKLLTAMSIDFAGSYMIEYLCSFLYDFEPKALIVKGRARREARRKQLAADLAVLAEEVKKTQ